MDMQKYTEKRSQPWQSQDQKS